MSKEKPCQPCSCVCWLRGHKFENEGVGGVCTDRSHFIEIGKSAH